MYCEALLDVLNEALALDLNEGSIMYVPVLPLFGLVYSSLSPFGFTTLFDIICNCGQIFKQVLPKLF